MLTSDDALKFLTWKAKYMQIYNHACSYGNDGIADVLRQILIFCTIILVKRNLWPEKLPEFLKPGK